MMPTVACPCCRAANTSGPNCRRCTTDLSLLFQLEERREYLLARIREELHHQQPTNAFPLLAEAEQLRPGDDLRELSSVTSLLNRDFATAFALARRSQS